MAERLRLLVMEMFHVYFGIDFWSENRLDHAIYVV